MAKLRRYGDNNTIHGTHHVDVETDKDGNVVAVWFRCQLVPFEQSKVNGARAREMKQVKYKTKLHALILEDA